MKVRLPEISLRAIRIAYVNLARALRFSHRSPPTYKCFRCKVLTFATSGPPYFLLNNLRCPAGRKYPWRQNHRWPILPLPAK